MKAKRKEEKTIQGRRGEDDEKRMMNVMIKTNQVSSRNTSTNPPTDHHRSAPLQTQSRGGRPLIAR